MLSDEEDILAIFPDLRRFKDTGIAEAWHECELESMDGIFCQLFMRAMACVCAKQNTLFLLSVLASRDIILVIAKKYTYWPIYRLVRIVFF